MTGHVIVVADTGIIAACDTSTMDRDGRLVMWSTKQMTLPHARAMIACAGDVPFGTMCSFALSEYSTFDDMIKNAEAVFNDVAAKLLAWNVGINVGITIAGWSEADQQWQAWHIGAMGADKESCVEGSFELWKINTIWVHPFLSYEELSSLGIVDLDDEGYLTALHWRGDETPIHLLNSIRSLKLKLRHDATDEYHIIGGEVVVTTIDHKGCSQRIAHRWPDRLGEPVAP